MATFMLLQLKIYMTQNLLNNKYLPAIEIELRNIIDQVDRNKYNDLRDMIVYHLGWGGDNVGNKTTGKRIRPLLLLLSCEAAGGEWEHALPAAASVELIHNFSLLHDDIEDNSPYRRGRPTVWKKWGIPQAINTGDSMFSLAHLSMLNLSRLTSLEITLKAARTIQRTCFELTQGQHLDISFEDKIEITVDDYWLMVGGKTASLLGTCTELGSLIAGNNVETQGHYKEYGYNLGLAFQVYDDYLGIWGDPSKIGKSTSSDLISGKKTLPVLYGLKRSKDFYDRWRKGQLAEDQIPSLIKMLEIADVRTQVISIADQFTQKALASLLKTNPAGEAGENLYELANQLLQRDR
jgi:geranylgeranyl diphosphate synthase type I